jgi:hypothetical protein
MQRYIFDIEVFPNLFCATFLNVETDETFLFSAYEKRNDLDSLQSFLDREITLVGYNNLFYDHPVLQYVLQNRKSKSLLSDIFDFSASVIATERGGFFNNSIRKYQLAEGVRYKQIDMMKIIEISGVAPSLKQAGINLQWKKVQDLPYPFDHVIQNEEEASVVYFYNLNDVLISKKLYFDVLPQIELREKLFDIFHVDLMNASNSKMADRLLEKFYVEEFHADMKVVRNLRTKRDQFLLKDCVAPNIQFETNYLKRIKNEIANTLVRKTNRYKYSKAIEFGGVKYELGVGGLHSVDSPAKFTETDEWFIYDSDVASYYPSIMINNQITPEHLGKDFIRVLERITKERLAAKKVDKVKAEALKVTINSIFGKLGSETFWLEDAKALRSVTVSGQLYLLMLIEKLVLSGIQVISANTDGVVSRVHKSQIDLFNQITDRWQKATGFILERTEYKLYFRQDVNNYITVKGNGEVKEKGRYVRKPEIKKGYKHPIVPVAMYEYVVNSVPVEQTIRNHKNILDFCISQKSGKDWQMEFELSENDTQLLQKNNRFYVSIGGGNLNKRHKEKGNVIGLLVGENVTILNDYDETVPIDEYDLNYDWYINEAKKYTEAIEEFSGSLPEFVDEAEDFAPPANTAKREEYFMRFSKVKGLPEKVIDNLMWLEDNFTGDNFLEFLVFAEDNGKMSSKIQSLIKLNHFSKYGNQKRLLRIYTEFTSGPNKYSAKLSDKSKQKRLALLRTDCFWVEEEDFCIWDQIENEVSVIGEPFSKYPVNNFYGFVREIDCKYGTPKVKLIKLSTGEERELKVYKNVMNEFPFKSGDILLCKSFKKRFRKTKDEQTGEWVETQNFDFYLDTYYKMKKNVDQFLPS